MSAKMMKQGWFKKTYGVLSGRLFKGAFAGVFITAACALSACSSTEPPPGVTPVSQFDVKRYEGTWYELARFEHSFERSMTNVSAHYSLQADGSVRVLNRGYDPSSKQWKQAEGKAFFTQSPSVGSLKVSFFGPFYGGYHVVMLDPDYRWALVVGPDIGYCWLLARDKQLTPEQMKPVLQFAEKIGIAIQSLTWVPQTMRDNAS